MRSRNILHLCAGFFNVNLWLAIAVFALTLLIHGPLNFKTNLLPRDDRWLTLPLRDVHSIGDWWALIRSASIPDFQPVRDLSYWFDWQLARLMGQEPMFHMTNYVLWCLILFFTWRVALSAFSDLDESPNKKQLWPALVLVTTAIHPVAVEPVAWISGRKHLLSVLFILFATLVWLRSVKSRRFTFLNLIQVAAAYLIACLSQPINVLWPVWAIVIFFAQKERKWWRLCRFKLVLLLGFLVAVSVMTFMLNMTVYQGKAWLGFLLTPHANVYGRKLDGIRLDEVILSLLAMGRYLFNFFLPVKIAHRYSPGSWANVAGLLTAPLLIWLALKVDFRQRKLLAKLPHARILLWGLHALLPVLVVTVQLSQIFVADSYALSALPALMIASALLAQSFGMGWRRLRFLFFCVWGMMLAGSMAIARSWMSVETMWLRSNAVEETPDSLYFTGGFLLNSGKHEEAMRHAVKLLEISGRNTKSIRLLAFVICDNPAFSIDQKIRNLKLEGISETPPALDCLSGLLEKSGDRRGALELLLRVADEAPAYFKGEAVDGFTRLEQNCAVVPDMTEKCQGARRRLGVDMNDFH
jgi:hypothetical protein